MTLSVHIREGHLISLAEQMCGYGLVFDAADRNTTRNTRIKSYAQD
jgi:hypothetical protein